MGARDLLADLEGAGLSIRADGDRLVIRPASRLTDDLWAAVRDAKPALLRLLAPTLAPAEDLPRTEDRHARLLRWGWSEADAAAMAVRLARRDLEQDDRRTCLECAHYRPGRCGNHHRAGLHAAELGRDLAALLQRCPGFS